MTIYAHGSANGGQFVFNNGKWIWTAINELEASDIVHIGIDPQSDSGVTAALTGTVISGGVLESEIVTGGETIIITLTDDTWAATVGADNSITDALIAGIDSAQSEAAGWDAVVKANMDYNDITRTSDTVVTITLGAEATYEISADETITITIPATALNTSEDAIVATPTFNITNESDLSIIPIVMHHYKMMRI